MKNIIVIDIDTDRENQVEFSKTDDFVHPISEHETINMVINDIKTLTHGLGSFIKIAESIGVSSSKDLLDEAVKLLRDTYCPKINGEMGE